MLHASSAPTIDCKPVLITGTFGVFKLINDLILFSPAQLSASDILQK